MSIHINCKQDEIAETVLLPGDPLRAKHIADNYLDESVCYNNVRGMLGYTGYFKGKRLSVQGTGMGGPSASIYINELINDYKVKRLIRIGTCGSLQETVNIRDIVLAMSASHDSSLNKMYFDGFSFAPTADFEMLMKVYSKIKESEIQVKVGNVISSDYFYPPQNDYWKMWTDYGVLAAEMETAVLYLLSAKFNAQALSILTVSDSLITGESTDSAERERTFNDMTKLALEIL